MLTSKNFKSKIVEHRFKYMHPFMKKIAAEMVEYLSGVGFLGVITCTVSTEAEDKIVSRVSQTHRQGRAFDLRTRNLPYHVVEDLIKHFNNLYGNLGAISAKSQKPTLIVNHDNGNGAHLHVQLSGVYIVSIPSDMDKIA